MRRRLTALALLALAAAAPAFADSVLHRGHHDEPESLDPHKSDGYQELAIESDLWEGVVRPDATGKLVAALAERWEVSPDGLVWTFHLRPGLEWSDGSPLAAEDFVWSIRRILEPETASPEAYLFYPVVGARAFNEGSAADPATVGITAPAPDTLQVTLLQPTPFLLGIMSLVQAAPVPRHAIEKAGAAWARPGAAISNGAFILASWTPQSEIVLKRNPHYWDAASVKLDEVHWVLAQDEETSLRLYRNGELDIAQVSPKDVRYLRQQRPAELHTDTTLRTDFLAVNIDRKPFDDLRIRRALSMAIDRDALAYKITAHGQKPATGLVPPGMPGYEQQPPDWAALALPDRIARAKALIAEAGFGPDKPLKIELSYPESEDYRLALTAIGGMWSKLGLEISFAGEENRVFNAALRDREHQIAYTDWIADYPDPTTFLDTLKSDAGEENASDYKNPAYDALLAQAAATLDPAERLGLLEKAELMANNDAAVIPVAYETRPMLVSPRVHGYIGNPIDENLSRDLSLDP